MTAVLGPPTAPVAGDVAESARVGAAVAMAWSLAAGVIHLLVAPTHLEEAWWLGAGFVAAGVAQLALAGLLVRPRSDRLLVAGIAGNVAVMAAYVATRTVDLWFMPAHGPGHEVGHLPVAGGVGNGIPVYPGDRIEPVGPLDLTCLVAELVVVAMLLAMLAPRLRSRVGTVLVAVAVTGAVVVLLA